MYRESPYRIQAGILSAIQNGTSERITLSDDDGAIVSMDGIDYLAFAYGGKSLYVTKTDVETKNILKWSEFFTVLEKAGNEDLLCDIKEEILDQIEMSDAEEKKLANCVDHAEALTKILNDQEPFPIVEALRKMVVKHPLEWNSELYDSLKPMPGHASQSDIDNMKASSKKLDVWTKVSGLSGIDGQKTLAFVNPLYFMNHLDRIMDHNDPLAFEKCGVWGMGIKSQKGNLLELSDGGKLICNVHWLDQRKNATVDFGSPATSEDDVHGWNMCNITSLAMVMAAADIKQRDPGKRFPDELFETAKTCVKDFKGPMIWEKPLVVYSDLVKEYSNGNIKVIKEEKYVDHTAEVKAQIDKGNPVIVSFDFYGRGDSSDGHIMVAVGYTNKDWILHDPYGNRAADAPGAKAYSTDQKGAYVRYELARALKEWNLPKKWYAYLEKK